MMPTLWNGAIGYLVGTSIAVIGLYIAYGIPIYLRWRAGDSFEPGAWTLGSHYRWINPIAVVLDHLHLRSSSSCRRCPTAIPWNSGFDWNVVNYAPITVGGRAARRRHLVARVGAGSGSRARSCREPRRSSSGSRRSSTTAAQLGTIVGVGSSRIPDRREPARAGSLHEGGQALVLTLEELRGDPTIDTVIMAFTDMQGRLMGKRLHRDFFFEQVEHDHGTEGCNYLLALDMEMEPGEGYALASWERGYGDFDLRPDLATLRRIPWLEATALVLCDVAWADGSPVRPSPRQVPARAGRAGARARLRGDGRVGARVLLAARDVRGGAPQGLQRPDAVGAVHPRLPHPRDDLRRAVAAADPQRDAGRGHPRRDVEGRGVARAAGDQLPLRRRADDGRQPCRLQERREGDRASERVLDHVHGEARPHVDRLLLPHPFVALARAARARSRARATRSTSTSPGRSPARASWRSSTRRTSTRTSGSPRAPGRRRRSPGGTTTARAASASSAPARRCGSSRASRAAT